jgi:tetratricopeptide (TPR) repeat protein
MFRIRIACLSCKPIPLAIIVTIAFWVLFASSPMAFGWQNDPGGVRLGGSAEKKSIEFTVRVQYDDNHLAASMVRIELLNGGSAISQQLANEEGQATFHNVPPGSYRLRITGSKILDFDSNQVFRFDNYESFRQEFIFVRRKPEASSTPTGVVNVNDMNVPEEARNEFNAGMAAANKQDFNSARDHTTNAIKAYPKFAAALELLGKIQMHLGDSAAAERSFQEAITANDKYAPALVDMGKLRMQQKKYNDAELMLLKAFGLEPDNVDTLMTLANVELLNNQYDKVLEFTQRAHALPHPMNASIHILAATAYEKQKNPGKAASEYQTYLKEAPNGSFAKRAQDALEKYGSGR